MRISIALAAACLMVSACGSNGGQATGGNDQAGALDNAATQSDPAAAAELREQADAIRNSGSEADMADPNSPAQNALQSAGAAATGNASAPPPRAQ